MPVPLDTRGCTIRNLRVDQEVVQEIGHQEVDREVIQEIGHQEVDQEVIQE